MTLSKRMMHQYKDGVYYMSRDTVANHVAQLEKQLVSARAIMQRFVDKVDSGRARSTETYGEMREWLDD